MQKPLPLLLSVPHGGMHVPKALIESFLPSPQETLLDGDLWTRYIYDFGHKVARTITTDIPRLIVDLNRSKTDFRPDGVIKQITLFQNPVWKSFPQGKTLADILRTYYDPYYKKLHKAAHDPSVKIGIDCHSMLPKDPFDKNAVERPLFCLSNRGNDAGEFAGEALTCPAKLLTDVKTLLEETFGKGSVQLNTPFQGGQIIQTMAKVNNLPWFQLEINRNLYENQKKPPSLQPGDSERRKLNTLKDKLFACFSKIAFDNPLYSPTLHPEQPPKKPIAH